MSRYKVVLKLEFEDGKTYTFEDKEHHTITKYWECDNRTYEQWWMCEDVATYLDTIFHERISFPKNELYPNNEMYALAEIYEFLTFLGDDNAIHSYTWLTKEDITLFKTIESNWDVDKLNWELKSWDIKRVEV